MIEDKIDALIASIDKNTAALIVLAGKQPKEAKPVKGAPAVSAEPPAKNQLEKDGPTKEDASKAVEELLKANKRKEAIALLAQFGAKAVSGIPADKYAAFVDEANGILLAE